MKTLFCENTSLSKWKWWLFYKRRKGRTVILTVRWRFDLWCSSWIQYLYAVVQVNQKWAKSFFLMLQWIIMIRIWTSMHRARVESETALTCGKGIEMGLHIVEGLLVCLRTLDKSVSPSAPHFSNYKMSMIVLTSFIK